MKSGLRLPPAPRLLSRNPLIHGHRKPDFAGGNFDDLSAGILPCLWTNDIQTTSLMFESPIRLKTPVDQLIQAMAPITQQTGLSWDQAIDQQPQNVQAVLAASWQ